MDSFIIEEEWLPTIKKVIRRIGDFCSIYAIIGHEIRVPWNVLAVIHYLECDLDFHRHIHNGDPLTARTVNVPAGRPVKPPKPSVYPDDDLELSYSFFESCQDWAELKSREIKAAAKRGWDNEATLDFLERNNGLGYRNKGLPSPYLWSGTNIYTKGKYTSDGVYDPNAISKQVGAVPLLIHLRGINEYAL